MMVFNKDGCNFVASKEYKTIIRSCKTKRNKKDITLSITCNLPFGGIVFVVCDCIDVDSVDWGVDNVDDISD